jgi:hypothetical protein
VLKERRAEVRIALSLPATVVFVDRRGAGGKPCSMECRAVSLSASAVAVTSAVEVSLGEHVKLRLEQFGEFRGEVSRQLDGGFVLKLEQTAAQSAALAVKIKYFEDIKNHDAPERRPSRRIVPRDRNSQLVWPDGSVESCTIIDISASGAAVSADTVPEIGAVLALGRLVGRVARLFDGGFAIQFTDEMRRTLVQAARNK